MHLVISRLFLWTNNGLAARMIVIIELERPNFGEKAQTESLPLAPLQPAVISVNGEYQHGRKSNSLSVLMIRRPNYHRQFRSLLLFDLRAEARVSYRQVFRSSPDCMPKVVGSALSQIAAFEFLFIYVSKRWNWIPARAAVYSRLLVFFFLSRCGISDFRMQYFLSERRLFKLSDNYASAARQDYKALEPGVYLNLYMYIKRMARPLVRASTQITIWYVNFCAIAGWIKEESQARA